MKHTLLQWTFLIIGWLWLITWLQDRNDTTLILSQMFVMTSLVMFGMKK